MSFRRSTLGVVAVAAASAAIAAGGGVAAAAPPVGPIGPGTTVSITTTGFTGDPWPFSTETVTATTGQFPGRTVFDVTQLCNSVNPGLCMRPDVLEVHWLNLSTGASGSTSVGPIHTMIYPPGVRTGAGQIIATVTWSDGRTTLIPGFGTFTAT